MVLRQSHTKTFTLKRGRGWCGQEGSNLPGQDEQQVKRTLEAPELRFELRESRPLAGIVRPALCHQAVESGRALRRHGQSLAVLYPANHVVVLHPLEGLDAVHQDLPHADACKSHTGLKFHFGFFQDVHFRLYETCLELGHLKECLKAHHHTKQLSRLTKHPDITGGGEPPEVDGFGGHPLDGEFTFRG